MPNLDYDPRKAHEYYLRTRQLKGRSPKQIEDLVKKTGSDRAVTRPKSQRANTANAKTSSRMRVVRLTEKVAKLQNALKEAEDALRAKREEAKKNSDGKTTAKERADSKKYRDTHKSQLATKRKEKTASTGSSSTSSTSSSAPKSVSEMSESELVDRVSKIKGLISEAKKQIQSANSLAHSLSDSDFISHSGPTAVNTN